MLAVVQILGEQYLRTPGLRGGDYEGIPERNLVSLFALHGGTDVGGGDHHQRRIQQGQGHFLNLSPGQFQLPQTGNEKFLDNLRTQ